MRIKLAVERGVMVAQFLVGEQQGAGADLRHSFPSFTPALQDQGTVLGDVMIDIGLGQDKLGPGKPVPRSGTWALRPG